MVLLGISRCCLADPGAVVMRLAAALKAEPARADTRIVMMGGALTVPGNVTTWSEANVAQDPAATDFLFRTARAAAEAGRRQCHCGHG